MVPDIPGFVVNRLLFPYLFSAAELMAETGLSAKDVDSCMTLGAGIFPTESPRIDASALIALCPDQSKTHPYPDS